MCHSFEKNSNYGIVIAAIIGSIFLLAFELKSDPFVFCKFIVGIVTLPALFVLAITVVEPTFKMVTWSIALWLAIIPATIFLIKTHWGPNYFDNLLQQNLQASDIFEHYDVQIVFQQPGKALYPNELFEFSVFLQNCSSETRTVTVHLIDEIRVSLNQKKIIHQGKINQSLLPGEVGKLRIPAFIETGATGAYSIRIEITADGPKGFRVRRWRANAIGEQISPWITMALPFFGGTVWGGGHRYLVSVNKEPSHMVTSEIPRLLPMWEQLWIPSAEEMRRVVKAEEIRPFFSLRG